MAISNQKLSSALPFDGRDGTGTAIKVYDHSRSYDNHDYILYAYENITHVCMRTLALTLTITTK